MGNVHFSGQHRDVPSYALNSPRDNVFETKNIRFHIDGKYLTDLSDKGIERFIEKNYNNKSGFLGGIGLGWGGKDLEFKEVKAFIQAAAANSDKLQGMSFNLTDPQLGLFDDDDVKVSDIRHSFDMEYKPVQGTSAGEVSFVDATKMRYDMREARNAETSAHDAFKGVQSSHRELQKDLQSATKARDKVASRIGDNAVQRLAEIDGKIQNLDRQLGDLDKDLKDVRLRLSQDHIPDSERRELRLSQRGMELEKKELESERNKVKKELTEKHGFWSFLGGGSNLEELRKANATVERAQRALERHRPEFDAARGKWDEAVKRREAVERGESLKDLDAASPTVPAASAEGPAAADTPDSPNGPAAVAGPVAPTTPSDAPVGEQHLQRIIALPADKQLEALSQVPEADRQAVLNMADEYLLAGREDNPLGLKSEDHAPIAQQRENLAKLRLNALLSWGEPAQKSYLDRVDDTVEKEVLAQLEQQLFDQQLATQALALRDRLKQAATEVPVQAEVPVPPSEPGPQPAQPAAPAGPETVQTGAGDQPAPVQGPPQGTVQVPLTLQAYRALPADQQLARFIELGSNEQDAVFSSKTFIQKGEILMALTQQNIEDQPTRERLSKLMPPADKQALVNQIAAIREAHGSTPHPRNTELSLLLGMFASQGVTPKAAPPVVPQSAPVSPAQETAPSVDEPSAPATVAQVQPPSAPVAPAAPAQDTAPIIVEEPPAAPAQPARPAAQPARPASPAQTAQPAQPAAAAASNTLVTDAEIEWAQTWSAQVEKGEIQPTQADKDRYSDIFRRAEAQEAAPAEPAAAARPAEPAQPAEPARPSATELANELKQMEPNPRMQAFASLTLEGKQAVFAKLPQPMQIETLLALAFDESFDADRKGLISSLDAGTKQKLAKAYNEGLPAAEIMKEEAPDLAPAMQKVIQELGAKVQPVQAPTAPASRPTAQPAQPLMSVQPTVQTASAPVLASVQPAPVSQASPQPIVEPPASPPAPGRLDMKTQIDQLSAIVKEKSYFGMGGVSNAAGLNELVAQIWGMGTDKNIQDMSKLLVNEGQSQVLANVLANEGVQSDGLMKVMATPGFPVKTFMNKIDDPRAYLILQTLAEVATRKDATGQRAQAMIVETVDAYKSGWDREEPLRRMKNTATASGHWQQLPKAIRDKIDGMLGTNLWN